MHFASAAGFLPILLLVSPSLARDHPDVSIEEPSPGTTYNVGDMVNVQWTSEQPVVSPSFRICQVAENVRRTYRRANIRDRVLARRDDDDDDCGAGIFPEAEKTGNGSYRASFQLPQDLGAQSYYLQMEDDFGWVARSPTFSISSLQGDSNDVSAAASSDAAASTVTPYHSKHEGTTSAGTPGQATLNAGAAEPIASAQAQTTGSSAEMPLPSATDGLLQGNSTVRYTQKGPVFVDSSNLLSSGRPTPVAAYAIPLAAAATALLIAGGLAIRHRGALRKERDKERKAIRSFEKLSRSSTISSQPACGAGDASSTAPQLPQPIQSQPIPLFMPISLPLSSSSSMPQTSLSRGYPAACEPRQITRNAYAYQSPVRVDRSVSGRPYSQSISNYTSSSTPITPNRSVRIRNLSTASTCFSPSSSANELGIARGIRDSSSCSAPYLPPLSFSNSSSRGLFASHLPRTTSSCTLAKEPSVVTNECMTSEVLEDYFLPPHLDSESQAPLDPTRPRYANYPPPLPLSLISAPQRLYVRNEAPSSVPLMSPGRNGHPADYSSQMGTAGLYQGGQTDVYAAVASLLDRSCP